jgi:hypothetical protein
MRSITEQSVNAFTEGQKFSKANMSIKNENGIIKMYLHKNLIATKDDNKLTITDAGWQSNTTKERLNALLNAYSTDVFIFQKNFEWYVGKDHKTATLWDGKDKTLSI